VPTERLLARVDAVDENCRRVVLAGGIDPLAHDGLEPLIARCRDRGLGAVTLECAPPALSRPGAPEHLAALGVSTIMAVCGGVRERVYEAVMATPGVWRDAMAGLAAAAKSALDLYVVLPLLRWNAEDARPLVEWLGALRDPVAGCLLHLPAVDGVPSEARKLLLPAPEQADIAASVFGYCRGHNMEYGFADRRGVSPCASRALDELGTVFHQRIRHLQRSDDIDLVRVGACDACSVANSCPGIERAYVELFGDSELRPVTLEVASAWRLKRINRLEDQDYKNVSAFDNDYVGKGRSLLRVNGHCQMACAFCFVDRSAPDFDVDSLKSAIDELAARHTDQLVLSGGEPTLHPDLTDLVAHARALEFRTIEIQTNGVRCADASYAQSLVDAGLGMATVSLHSPDPARSDTITKMPGAFPKTVEGLRNLRALGVRTQIAHVITKTNYQALPAMARFLSEELVPERGGLSVCFAIAQGISDLVYSWTIPRFTDIRPYMREALDLCMAAGIGFGGLIGQGGYPPCMLDGDLGYYEGNLSNVYRSADYDDQFYKPERCRECSFDAHCVGVRRDYIRCYGDEEIRPFQCQVVA
jgi:MoaA/NifB/PqqE/SkfB family radical SAM enzyme